MRRSPRPSFCAQHVGTSRRGAGCLAAVRAYSHADSYVRAVYESAACVTRCSPSDQAFRGLQGVSEGLLSALGQVKIWHRASAAWGNAPFDWQWLT